MKKKKKKRKRKKLYFRFSLLCSSLSSLESLLFYITFWL